MRTPPLEKILDALNLHGLNVVLRADGSRDIFCPFSNEVTHGVGKTILYPPNGKYKQCVIKCYDAGCEGRETGDFLEKLGLLPNGEKVETKTRENLPPKLTQAKDLLCSEWPGRLRLNVFTLKRELDGRELDDPDITQIRLSLEDMTGRAFGKDITFDAVYWVCRENSYDPLKDYLNSLVWDGIPRIDTWLTDVYGVENTEYTKAAGRCWLISGVARGLSPGCKVRLVLLVQGLEDIGKSLSLVHICPHREWFTDNLPADLHDKDAAIALAGKWIVESPEMASMRRSEQESIKAFLSRDVDDYRPAYGRCNVQVPRRCIIAATTNPDDVLSAREENTRYLPIKAMEYNQDYMTDTRDQLWAEAVALYKDGVKWWMTDDTTKEQARIARRLFVETDPWDDEIIQWLKVRSESAEPTVTASEALIHLGIETAHYSKRDEMRVTSIFKKLGWEKGPGRDRYKWGAKKTVSTS